MRRLLAALSAAWLVACHAAPSQRPETVRLAVHQDPIAFLPVRIATSLGYDREEGLQIEASEVAGGAKALQAMIGGSVDVAAASMSDAVQLAVEGRDVQGFLLIYTRPTAALVVAPPQRQRIRSIGDLQGHTVGVTAPGSGSHQILNFLLVSSGVAPEAVSTVSIGMAASSVAAVERGTVEAAVLIGSAIPAFEGRHPEMTPLADLRMPADAQRVFGSAILPSLGLVAEGRWLRAHGDAARRLSRSILRGMQWVREHRPEEVREMIPSASRMDVDRDLDAIRHMQSVLSVDGMMPAGSAALIARFVAASNPKFDASRLDIERVYTSEFASLR